MQKDTKAAVRDFGERLKAEPAKLHMQEVKPVIGNQETNESQLNVWIPNELMKKIRLLSAETRKSQKEITIDALTKYFT
jgi:hypothetical protein